jgi:hypothetical protein
VKIQPMFAVFFVHLFLSIMNVCQDDCVHLGKSGVGEL